MVLWVRLKSLWPSQLCGSSCVWNGTSRGRWHYGAYLEHLVAIMRGNKPVTEDGDGDRWWSAESGRGHGPRVRQWLKWKLDRRIVRTTSSVPFSVSLDSLAPVITRLNFRDTGRQEWKRVSLQPRDTNAVQGFKSRKGLKAGGQSLAQKGPVR